MSEENLAISHTRGVNQSGRPWKEVKKPFRHLSSTKVLKSTWDRKMKSKVDQLATKVILLFFI